MSTTPDCLFFVSSVVVDKNIPQSIMVGSGR
jgi:hypothetical protein